MIELHYLDGCPGLVIVSGGEEWFVRLHYSQIKFRGCEAYCRYTVPDHPLVIDTRLRGGAFWFRLTATPEEKEADTYPTAKVRPVPECAPQFQTVFGLSEDTEAMHRNYKDCLFGGRARSLGPEGQRADMRGYRSRSNLRAALAYIRRTGEQLEEILLPEPVTKRSTGPPPPRLTTSS